MKRLQWRLLGVIVLVAVGIGMYPMTALELSDGITEQTYHIALVKPEECITYSFIHSVSQTPIVEYLMITEEYELNTYRVDYKDQSGAGLPEYASEGTLFREEDGWFVIDEMNRIYEKHQIHVNELYENRVEIDGEIFRLYEYFSEGKGLIGIEVKRLPLIEYYVKLGLSTW